MLVAPRVALTLIMAMLPAAAAAEGVAFTVPAHYFAASAPAAASKYPIFRVWNLTTRPGHTLIISTLPAGQNRLAAFVDAAVGAARGRGGIDLVRSDAEPLCGAPSIRVTYDAYQLRFTNRYVIVAGRLLFASYAHPIADAADPNAVAAPETLCSGVYQSGGVAGWTITAPYPPNIGAWTSPDGQESFAQFTGGSTAGVAAPPFTGKGTVTNDRHETCGTISYHRFTVTYNGKINENAEASVGGYQYTFAYQRPEDRPANAAALALLTGFCDGT